MFVFVLVLPAVLEIPRDDTPELSEHGLGSPLSTISAATSHTAGEPDVSMAEEVTGVALAAAAGTTLIAAAEAGTVTAAVPGGLVGLMLEPSLIPPLAIKLPKFRADGLKYRYGNFDRYVDFRQLNEFRDVRLQVFERHSELFQNKDILDIGCNVGHMTITVARHLAPKSILGIDIDRELVARARRNLSIFVRIPKEEPTLEAGGAIKQEAAQPQQPLSTTPDKMDVADAHKKTRRGKKRRKAQQQQQQQLQLQQQQQQQLALQQLHAHHTHHSHHHHHHHNHNHHNHHHHHHHHHHHNHNQEHLEQLQQQQKLDELLVKPHEFFPISFPLTYGGIPHLPPNAQSGAVLPGKNQFPQNVFFRQTNYVLKDESLMSNDTQQYDLILCLSVTKWIHLNFGDAGLKLAFKRIFNQLRPGGKLILEAQNWASYKKKKNLTVSV